MSKRVGSRRGTENRWGQLALGCVLLLSACSSGSEGGDDGSGGSASSPASGGAGSVPTTGGVAGSGGSSAGSGGSAAGSTGSAAGSFASQFPPELPLSEAGACVIYSEAFCRKAMECRGMTPSVESCVVAAADCPDALLSEGSTRTTAGLLDCAERLDAIDCAAFLARDYPACVSLGEKAAGEPCTYASQCEELACSTQGGSCGVCQTTAPDGAACSDPTVACQSGICSKDGVCEADSAPEELNCGDNPPCREGQFCDGTTCVTPGGLHEHCTDSRGCAEPFFCSRLNDQCESKPGVGETCGSAYKPGVQMACAEGLACSMTAEASATCVTLPGEGEPCFTEAIEPLAPTCAEGLRCYSDSDASTCRSLGTLGSPCEHTSLCSKDLFCACDNWDSINSCEASTCREMRWPTEACGDGQGVCHPAARCIGNVCTPRELQGNYADLCE